LTSLFMWPNVTWRIQSNTKKQPEKLKMKPKKSRLEYYSGNLSNEQVKQLRTINNQLKWKTILYMYSAHLSHIFVYPENFLNNLFVLYFDRTLKVSGAFVIFFAPIFLQWRIFIRFYEEIFQKKKKLPEKK